MAARKRTQLPEQGATLDASLALTALQKESDKLRQLADVLGWQVVLLKRLRTDDYWEARQALLSLCRKCDKSFLLLCLWALRPGGKTQDTWHALVGFDRRQTSTICRALRKSANVIERLNSRLLVRYVLARFSFWRSVLPELPKILRAYAAFVEKGPRELRVQPKARPITSFLRAALIAHVRRRTGAPHDRELSALYGAALQGPYDAERWRTWRLRHQKLIQQLARSAR